MSHFYITLPSNASMDVYPNNTVAKYTTKLAQSVELDGSWEAGLVEITYPNDFDNIRENEMWFRVFYDWPRRSGFEEYIPPGFYSTVNELIDPMNAHFADQELGLKFSYNNSRVSLTTSTTHGLRLSRKLASILKISGDKNGDEHMGFGMFPREFYYFGSTLKPTIRDGYVIRKLFVYCDVLEHVHVGNTMAPLLRTVAVNGSPGETVNCVFDNPIYLPVQKKVFDSVEINIMTDTGEPAPFKGGKSLVTVHFRRTTSPYFMRK